MDANRKLERQYHALLNEYSIQEENFSRSKGTMGEGEEERLGRPSPDKQSQFVAVNAPFPAQADAR
jgi:hypothetical protein